MHAALLPRLALLLLAAGASPALADWPSSPTVNVPLCTATGAQGSAAGVSDGAGGAIVAWGDGRGDGGGGSDIYVQHVLASGVVDPAWPADGRAVCTAANVQRDPTIASDGAGGAIVAWLDLRSVYAIYAQHVLASGAVDPLWPADGRLVSTGEAYGPPLVPDGAGGAVVAFADSRLGVVGIYVQHVLASGALDPAWPAGGRGVSTPAGAQNDPVLVPDGSAGALVAWDEYHGGNTSVLAQHVLGSGAVDPAWPPAGLALSAASGAVGRPGIVADLAGGAIVVWGDVPADGKGVFAQHPLASGAIDPAWPAGGRRICSMVNSSGSYVAATDDAGGAIVLWVDQRTVGDTRDYAHHVEATGDLDPAWPAGGTAVFRAWAGDLVPRIVPDGTGGVVAAWADTPPGGASRDILAQHLLASGAVDPAWPATGRAVCSAPADQRNPTIVPDGSGGAVIAWEDARNGGWDVYAQGVRPDGLLDVPAVVDRGDHDVEFSPPGPSPAVRSTTFRYRLPRQSRVRLALQDPAGRTVRVLDEGVREPGARAVEWDLRDGSGRALPAGVYFARLEVDGRRFARRIVTLP